MDLSKMSMENLKEYIKLQISGYQSKIEEMKIGEAYYNGEQEILTKQRLGIGEDGKRVVIANLPNSQIMDNQYKRAVDQKINYQFSKPFNIDVKDSAEAPTATEKTLLDKAKDMFKKNVTKPKNMNSNEYEQVLSNIFDMRFLRTMNKIARDTYNCRIGWLYIKSDGRTVDYKKMDPKEIIPIWRDNNQESLDALIRIYSYQVFENRTLETKQQVHLYTDKEIMIFDYENGELGHIKTTSYLQKGDKFFNYGDNKIPFIYFKLADDKPLVFRVKCLQDALNRMLSNFTDNMLEDPRNTILIIKNYDGEDLGKFRQNLTTYGAVKVTSEDGMNGGVESLQIEVNAENYETIVRLLKQGISENARSLDLKNAKTTQSPNMLNIKSMYSDMELDANALELEYLASLEYFCEFVKQVYNFGDIEVDMTFKRNIMVNDESIVTMIRELAGLEIVSNETLTATVPFVNDVAEELERIKKERDEEFKDEDVFGVGDDDVLLGGKSSPARES